MVFESKLLKRGHHLLALRLLTCHQQKARFLQLFEEDDALAAMTSHQHDEHCAGRDRLTQRHLLRLTVDARGDHRHLWKEAWLKTRTPFIQTLFVHWRLIFSLTGFSVGTLRSPPFLSPPTAFTVNLGGRTGCFTFFGSFFNFTYSI